jgi:hypothetical protein
MYRPTAIEHIPSQKGSSPGQKVRPSVSNSSLKTILRKVDDKVRE